MKAKIVVTGIGVAVVACIWLAIGRRHSPTPSARQEAAQEAANVQPGNQRQDTLSAGRLEGSEGSAAAFKDPLRAERHRFPGTADSTLGGAARHAGGAGAEEQPDAGDEQTSDEDDFESVKQTALTDSDAEERANAVMLISSYDDALALPVLTRALSDSDAQVRLAALDGLESLTEDPPFETFASAVDDPDPEVRMAALKALMNLDGDRAQPLIQRALDDPDEDVRDWAEVFAEDPSDDADGAATGQAASTDQAAK